MCGHRLRKQKRSRKEAENRVFSPASFETSPASLQKTKGAPASFENAKVFMLLSKGSPASFKRSFAHIQRASFELVFQIIAFLDDRILKTYVSDTRQMIANNVLVKCYSSNWYQSCTTVACSFSAHFGAHAKIRKTELADPNAEDTARASKSSIVGRRACKDTTRTRAYNKAHVTRLTRQPCA